MTPFPEQFLIQDFGLPTLLLSTKVPLTPSSNLSLIGGQWSRDGIASHVLTSRLSSSVLGSLPIANERMGQHRSARTVYFTLRHQYGAGDYSSVMIIEAHLRQLRCLPSRGGVRVGDFINTWHVSVNQMEAAGFLPGPQQLLSIFADGLPNNTVAFINLYDSIISSLNEPDESSLPTIYYLFDVTLLLDVPVRYYFYRYFYI